MVFKVGIALLQFPTSDLEAKSSDIGLEFGNIVIEIADLLAKSFLGESTFETALPNEGKGRLGELGGDIHEKKQDIAAEAGLILGKQENSVIGQERVVDTRVHVLGLLDLMAWDVHNFDGSAMISIDRAHSW